MPNCKAKCDKTDTFSEYDEKPHPASERSKAVEKGNKGGQEDKNYIRDDITRAASQPRNSQKAEGLIKRAEPYADWNRP